MLYRRRINKNPEMIADQNGIDLDTKTYRFGHFSGPSYRGAHAGWLVRGVSGAHRLVLFIQLEVAHKHFRLARPTESAQGGGGRAEHATSVPPGVDLGRSAGHIGWCCLFN